jgi:hypothetical protein
MSDIRLGPQDDDDEAEELAQAVDQLWILEAIGINTTYGPMTGSEAAARAKEMFMALSRSGGEAAVRIMPLTPWPNR